MVSGRADRYYTLLKGDLEVIAAKGNLIIPRRNSTTGCSLMSYPGHIIIIIITINIIIIIIIIIILDPIIVSLFIIITTILSLLLL